MDTLYKSDHILDQIKNKTKNTQLKIKKTKRYVIFKLAGKLLALQGDNSMEVNSIDEIFFFPQVHPWLKGLVNIRGEVHSIVDLKEVLDLESPDEEAMQILFKSGDIVTAIAIDDIVDVVDLSEDDIVFYIDEENENEYLMGIADYREREVIIINGIKIIDDLAESLENIE